MLFSRVGVYTLDVQAVLTFTQYPRDLYICFRRAWWVPTNVIVLESMPGVL